MNPLLKDKPTNCLKQQQGMSLIGLMVGMLLSVLSVLAAMTMYHNMVDVAIDTRHAAEHDAQLATAIQVIQLELQSAGFGIAATSPGTHVLSIGSSIYWRFANLDATTGAPTYQCRELKYHASGKLTLNSLNNCNASAALDTRNWNTNNEVILLQFKATIADTDTAATMPNISFSVSPLPVACWPYGRAAAISSHQQVTITADNAASHATNNAGTQSAYNICLPNLS